MTGTEVAKNINKNNANHAIVFEAIALALALEADTELLTASVGLLGKFIGTHHLLGKLYGCEPEAVLRATTRARPLYRGYAVGTHLSRR